jgi:hypothetical protein
MSSEQKAPITAAQVVAAVPEAEAVSSSTLKGLELLLSLMLKKEEANLIKEDGERKRQLQIAAQREKTQSQNAYKIIRLQATCKHLKGGRRLKADTKIDYNVVLHVFPDGVWQIKCHSCAARWRKQDTKEFLFRGGKKIPNHTRMGWTEALVLVDQSTNTFSSSEVPSNNGSNRAAEDFVIPDGFEF